MAQDRFEKPNITVEALPHTGKLEGDLQELPHTEGTPSIQEFNDLDTGQLEQVIPAPETSGALTLEDNERDDFQRKLTAQREYHEQRASRATESHTGRNIAIGATTLLLAGGTVAGVVIANNQPSNTSPEANPSATGAPVPGETQAPAETKPAESPLASPTNLGPLETTKPTPSSSETAPGSLNEFGITATEYAAIKESLSIDAAQYTTPEAVTAAFMERLERYYAGGHSMKERAAHYTAQTPSGGVGWNAWSEELYTKALEEATFISGYRENIAGNVLQTLADNKEVANRLWVNAAKAHEKNYVINQSFEITDIAVSGDSFTVTGTEIVTDNSNEVPSAASDSQKIGTLRDTGAVIQFMKDPVKNKWFVVSKMSN